MAVKTVKFTLNGQTYDLTYDSTSGNWQGTITAPGTTSWDANSDHTFHGTVVATDIGGNSTMATVADFSGLALRVLEKTPPAISVTYPTAGAHISNSEPSISWDVTDTGSGIDSSTISIALDNGSAVTDGIAMEAISGAPKQVHIINSEKCINCGACVTNCPFGAIAAAKEG